MPKATPAQWSAARVEWEADPHMTLTDVAHKLNMKLGSVSEKVKRDGWLKMLPEVQDAAQQAADVLSHISGRQELIDKATTALDLSVAGRVQVLNRHRNSWADWRKLFPIEAMASSPVAARRAKAAAEALALAQRGECIAFGISTFSGRDTEAPLVEPEAQPGKPKSKMELDMEHFLRTGEPPQPQLGYDHGA